MIHINLGVLSSITSSPLAIIIITVSIPLAVFFYFFFKMIIPRLGSRNLTTETVVQQQAPTQQPQQNTALEELLKNLINRLEKSQSDMSNVFTSSIEELKQMLQNLNSTIEDALLSLKSQQSDLNSPFNVISQQQVDKPNREASNNAQELRAVAQIVGNNNIDLTSFIKNCVLLEVLEYDNEKITALYNLGFISPDDMYIIMKIESYLRSNNGKIKAKDLAQMAINVAESYSSATPDMKKYILVLEREGGEEKYGK